MSRANEIMAGRRHCTLLHYVLSAAESKDMPWLDKLEWAVVELVKENQRLMGLAVEAEQRRVPGPWIVAKETT